jgi:hypothetical protein
VCVVNTPVPAASPNEKLLQEFAEGLIVGTVGIGVYCSMGADPHRGTPQLRNLLPMKIITSSAAPRKQILDGSDA